MNKKTIILIIAAILVVGIVAACLLFPKDNNSNPNDETTPTQPIETQPVGTMPEDFDASKFPAITIPGPENSEEFLHESFDIAKEVLGEEYYPNVTVNPEDIPEMFGINSDYYSLAFAQICDDEKKADMIIAIQAKDADAMSKIVESFHNYAAKLKQNTNYPEHVRTALNVYMTTTDVWNYVFFVTTFGDLDSVADKTDAEIQEFAEKNAMKVINALALRDYDSSSDITNPDK